MRRKLTTLFVFAGLTCSVTGACNDWIDQLQGQPPGELERLGQKLDDLWEHVDDLLDED